LECFRASPKFDKRPTHGAVRFHKQRAVLEMPSQLQELMYKSLGPDIGY